MKWLPVLCYLGIAGWQVAVQHDGIFPGDPAKRHAFDMCFMESRQFDRLDAAARAACFKEHGVPLGTRDLMTPPMQLAPAPRQANFVDLWKAAGQGQMRGNDIRAVQQTGPTYR